MNEWVLIIMVWSGSNGVHVESIEFGSREFCEKAKLEVSQEWGRTGRFVCVERAVK